MSVTPSPSDLESSLPIIKNGLIGYRNLLSYVSSLGLDVIPRASIQPDTWTQIDSGAFSTVWKATSNLRTRTVVAVKQPKASFTREKAELEDELQNQALSSMIQELRILAHPNLKDHPNLPHALGVFFQEEENPPGIRPCVVLELAISDLHNHLQMTPPNELGGKEMVRLSSHVASGICALHAYGLVHGDIKPKNTLLFVRDGKLVAAISDLGTCGVISQTSGVIPGTRSFYAPEVFEKSNFHHLANQPSRDVYSFGLLVFSILIRCSRDPFPHLEQFDIQHDDLRCLKYLLDQLNPSSTVLELENVIKLTVKSNPADRAQVFEVIEGIEIVSGEHRLFRASYKGCIISFVNWKFSQHDLVQDLAEKTLVSDPESPRVNALAQMPLPSGLMSKLLSEFIVASSHDTHSARLAFTMAAFYSGALGSGVERPWDVVAKTQWLLKAVELGSFAAVSGIMLDKNSCQILEEFGAKILKVRQLFFNSPSIDYQTLVYRLRSFADMPDVESLNVLVFLGEAIPEEAERTITRLTYGKNERQQRIRLAIPNLSRLEVFNLNRDSDLQVVDSDAFDLVLSNASEITTAVYNNNLEKFISLAESSGLKSGDLEYFMSLAIFNGSKNVVWFLLDQYHVDPNQSWGGMSHLNDAIVFRRQSIVELFLNRNAMIEPAFGNKLSALHLVPRDDDPKLATLLCEHLNTKGTLQAVLNSSTTDGDLAGLTPVCVAMMCRSWKVAQVFLDYGADPNDGEDDAKLLDMSVLPMSTPTPLSILQTLLQKGAKTDGGTAQSRGPLKMAIQSSNVLAVFHLLLHDASIIFADSTTAIEEAESSMQEMQTGPRLEVLSVDGDLCPNGWEDCSEASSVILEMVRIASAKENNWKNDLCGLVSRSPETCKSKMWILDQQINEATMLVEVTIPS